jgi:regulator of protease activity HflC (stomatin/prohibitin superfamily)
MSDNVKTVRPRPSGRGIVGVLTLGVAALIALGALGLVFAAWRTIEPGYVGIVFDKASRKVTNTLDPGWVFINPFTQSITKYPVGVQTLVMVLENQEGRVAGDDSVKVGSREGQTMNADVSVQYSVSRDNAAQLYQTWAGAPIERIEDNLVRQVTRSALNDIASQYGWEDIYGEKRIEYTQKVSAQLQQRFGEKFVKFESLNLRGWHLPENLQRALEQKIAAQQAAEQQKFQLEQATIKAQQDKVAAEGEANALRARAQGEADATKIRAEAQAEANQQLASSLTPALIEYEQLQRWDGKLPVFSGGGATPLIDATSIISGTAGAGQ